MYALIRDQENKTEIINYFYQSGEKYVKVYYAQHLPGW